jgi:ribosome-associated protein
MTSDRGNALGDMIVASLADDKAEDIVRIDLTGKSSIADEMIVASGRSARHVNALADHIQRKLKDDSATRARVDGKQTCDWVVIDAGDVVVHLFRPEVREFYQLERIWGDAPEAGKHRQQS